MFDFAWSELGLIAVVALIVIGPKDLPRVLRTVGTYVRKARSIAREFQGSLDEMVREVELDDVKRTISKATSFNLEEEFNKTVDPDGELKRSLSDPLLTDPLADHAESAVAAAEPTTPAIEAPAEPAALPAPAEEAVPTVEASAEQVPAIEAPPEPAPIEPTPAEPTPAELAPPAAAPAAPEPPRAAERVASSNRSA